MADDSEQPTKKRKHPWWTSYTDMTQEQAEERIGIRMEDLASVVIPVKRMLVQEGYSFDGEDSDAIMTIKEDVYKQILRYLTIEGYPTESSANFKEQNVSDLVLLIIGPILEEFIYRTARNKVKLVREKKIVSEDLETGGFEKFVVVDRISVTEEKYIFIIEAKREPLGAAMKQCLLSMKNLGDSNYGGVIFGFVTTGESWRMLKYDGTSFQVTEKIHAAFETMREDKERWMRDYSIVVDCIYVALLKEL